MFSLTLLGLALFADPAEGSRLAVIRQAPRLSLTTQDGKTITPSDQEGNVLLVSFVFTTCNGSCPATTHRIGQVQQELKSRGLLPGRVRLLSITLDPARDTPEALRRYARLYDADLTNWHFLTGSPAEVEKVTAAWGMWVKPMAGGQLDHPSRIFLVDGRGRVREVYNLAFLKASWVVEDVAELLKEAGTSP